MKLTKAFYLDENYLFPNCPDCNTELTPYCVTSEEFNTMNDEFCANIIKCQLIRINAIEINKHVIFLCKNCCEIIREE